jgi:hypothetical protein
VWFISYLSVDERGVMCCGEEDHKDKDMHLFFRSEFSLLV